MLFCFLYSVRWKCVNRNANLLSEHHLHCPSQLFLGMFTEVCFNQKIKKSPNLPNMSSLMTKDYFQFYYKHIQTFQASPHRNYAKFPSNHIHLTSHPDIAQIKWSNISLKAKNHPKWKKNKNKNKNECFQHCSVWKD